MWVQERLTSLRDEKMESPVMLESLETIVTRFSDEQLIGCSIVYRDYETLSIEWPSKSVYCCIYSESIEIDRVSSSLLDNGWHHDITVFNHDEIDRLLFHLFKVDK